MTFRREVACGLVIWSFALLIGAFYPLSRRRMAEIRAELEARRGGL